MNHWSLSLLPLVGIAVGAILQFWFNRTKDAANRLNEQRLSAYSDFLRGVAASARLSSDEDLRAALLQVADAKCRIAIYGTPEVIDALAAFELSGPNVSQSPSEFIAVVRQMRQPSGVVADASLSVLLLGEDQGIPSES